MDRPCPAAQAPHRLYGEELRRIPGHEDPRTYEQIQTSELGGAFDEGDGLTGGTTSDQPIERPSLLDGDVVVRVTVCLSEW